MRLWPPTGIERDRELHAPVTAISADHLREEFPTDPTPTVMEWRAEQFAGEWGAVGIERPAALEHADRAAGRWILDGGVWREIRCVYVPLPSDPDKAEVMTKLREAAT